jgi:hypothetical protein
MRIHHLIFCALAVLGFSACGDDSADSMEGLEEDGGDTPFEAVECPSDLRDMTIGMEAIGAMSLIKGKLTDADKIPIGWYHNDWAVSFTGPDGEALDGLAIDRAYTFMPDHGHEGGVDAVVEELGDDEFSFEGLNVTMGGLWEFTFEVNAENAEGQAISDTVVFEVCNSQPKPKGR